MNTFVVKTSNNEITIENNKVIYNFETKYKNLIAENSFNNQRYIITVFKDEEKNNPIFLFNKKNNKIFLFCELGKFYNTYKTEINSVIIKKLVFNKTTTYVKRYNENDIKKNEISVNSGPYKFFIYQYKNRFNIECNFLNIRKTIVSFLNKKFGDFENKAYVANAYYSGIEEYYVLNIKLVPDKNNLKKSFIVFFNQKHINARTFVLHKHLEKKRILQFFEETFNKNNKQVEKIKMKMLFE